MQSGFKKMRMVPDGCGWVIFYFTRIYLVDAELRSRKYRIFEQKIAISIRILSYRIRCKQYRIGRWEKRNVRLRVWNWNKCGEGIYFSFIWYGLLKVLLSRTTIFTGMNVIIFHSLRQIQTVHLVLTVTAHILEYIKN